MVLQSRGFADDQRFFEPVLRGLQMLALDVRECPFVEGDYSIDGRFADLRRAGRLRRRSGKKNGCTDSGQNPR